MCRGGYVMIGIRVIKNLCYYILWNFFDVEKYILIYIIIWIFVDGVGNMWVIIWFYVIFCLWILILKRCGNFLKL